MDDLTTERSFGLQATWVTDVLGLLFLIVTTRHRQTSGRRVQELNECTAIYQLVRLLMASIAY